MKILINDRRKLFAIQEDFSGMFPCLELRFFARPKNLKSSASRKLVENSKTLGECRIVHTKGTLTITPQMSVAELEENFRSIYGLSVQVVAKIANKRITLRTRKEITLEELNANGSVLNKALAARQETSKLKKSNPKSATGKIA